MRSELKALAAAAALAMVSATGCTARFGERMTSGSSMGLGNDTKCLSGGSQVIAEYYQGQSKDEKKISGLWDCASRSLKLFAERTEGKTAGVYTPKELKIFLEEHFLDKYEITPAMLRELMALKRTLLGGADDSLTVDELQAARKLMDILREQSLKLRPYLPLTVANYAQADEAKVAGARAAIEGFAHEISRVLTGTGADYEFSHIDTLMREFEAMAQSSGTQDAFHAVRDYLPMLQQLKAVLISGDSSRIASRDWDPMLHAAARGFGLYLHTLQLMGKNPSIITGEGRDQILGVVSEVLSFLEDAIERRPEKAIAIREFQELAAKADGGLLLVGKNRITGEHLGEFMKPLFTKLLGREDTPGLNRQGVARLREILGRWADGQRYIDRSFEVLCLRPSMGSPLVLSRSQLLGLSIGDILDGDEGTVSARTWQAAERVRKIISSVPPMYLAAESSRPTEIWLGPVAPSAKDPDYSYRALTYLYLMDVAAGVFIEAYAAAPAAGVSESEFKDFFKDIKKIAGDLRIVDPDNNVSFLKRFVESNLFLSVSNGNGYMDRDETALMLSYAVSAKAAGGRVHQLIAGICNRDEARPLPVDVFGNETIEENCYRREFFAHLDEAWGRLPGLLNYYKGLGAAERERFEANLNAAARSARGPRFVTQDSEGYLGLSQYLEAFFARFDRDHDGTIEKYEAMQDYEGDASAYSVFHDTLKQATCKIGSCVESEFILKNVFSYLLANGEAPKGADMAGWILRPPFLKKIRADRGDITAVLANLSRAVAPKPAETR